MINQDVAQIPRFIKDRIETTYRMQKHIALGLRNRYRVDVFQGIKLKIFLNYINLMKIPMQKKA